MIGFQDSKYDKRDSRHAYTPEERDLDVADEEVW